MLRFPCQKSKKKDRRMILVLMKYFSEPTVHVRMREASQGESWVPTLIWALAVQGQQAPLLPSLPLASTNGFPAQAQKADAALQMCEYFSVIWAASVGFCSDLEVLQCVILPGSLILPIPFLFHSLSLAAKESFNLIPEHWLYLTERTKTPFFIHLWCGSIANSKE